MSSFMLSAAPILWLILVILLIVLEVATYQLVAIWFALGAAAALIVSLFELSGTAQIVVFIAVSALSLMASRPLVKIAVCAETEDQCRPYCGSDRKGDPSNHTRSEGQSNGG